MEQKEKPGAGQATGQGSNTVENNNKSQLKNQQVFPYYKGFNETSPIKKLSLSGLELLLEAPRTGPKDRTLPCMTPFTGNGKTNRVARVSQYYAVIIDHDADNKDKASIKAIYDPYDMAYCAWTTSSHKQPGKGNRWKVLIPFYKPCDHDTWNEISQGTVLLLGTCKSQAQSAQVFYIPNKLTSDAPYEYINKLDRPFFEPGDNFHPFNGDCLTAYTQEQQKREQQAAAAIPTPRQVNGSDGNIIEKINQAFHMGEVLTGAGYKKKSKGKEYLSPGSESGEPGVYILNRSGKDVVYSHHGESDPLSNQNNNGHSLDVFDVICKLQYGGDVTRAIRELAPQVDPEGQKKRQKEHMEQEAAGKTDSKKQKNDFNLSGCSLHGQTEILEAKMQDDVHVLSKLALMGEITILYAPPGAGKTLLLLYLLSESIREGNIKGKDVFYINCDDSYKGFVHKNKIAEKWGFNQLVPGQGPDEENTFQPEHLMKYLKSEVDAGTAQEKVIILDTLKKFVNMMSKEKTAQFFNDIRKFNMNGGTLILLAHTNKHRDEDKKVVFEGVGDSKADSDCSFTLDVLSETLDGTRVVKFENQKMRGYVEMTESYSYDASPNMSYAERLASVKPVDNEQLKQAEKEQRRAAELAKDKLIVDVITEAIQNNINTKTALLDEAVANTGDSKRKITKVLLKYTGKYENGCFWFPEKGDRRTIKYQLNYEYYQEVTGNIF